MRWDKPLTWWPRPMLMRKRNLLKQQCPSLPPALTSCTSLLNQACNMICWVLVFSYFCSGMGLFLYGNGMDTDLRSFSLISRYCYNDIMVTDPWRWSGRDTVDDAFDFYLEWQDRDFDLSTFWWHVNCVYCNLSSNKGYKNSLGFSSIVT